MASKVYKVSGIVVIILSVILGLLLFRTDSSMNFLLEFIANYNKESLVDYNKYIPAVYNWETLVRIAGVGSVLGLMLIGIGDMLDILRFSNSSKMNFKSNNYNGTVTQTMPQNQEKTIQPDSSVSYQASLNK